MKYKIKFADNRIGRNKNVRPQIFEAETANDLAEQIYNFADKYLVSSGFEVILDLDRGKGSIECGRYGNFEILTEADLPLASLN